MKITKKIIELKLHFDGEGDVKALLKMLRSAVIGGEHTDASERIIEQIKEAICGGE